MKWFRVSFGIIVLLFYFIRGLDLEFWFSDQGILRTTAIPHIYEMAFRFSVFDILRFPLEPWMSNALLYCANGFFLICLALFTAGVVPRASVCCAFILHVSFLHRNMGVIYGVDRVATFFLLYFCLADYRRRQEKITFDWRKILGSVAFRLCQLQVCIVYAYSGWEKLKGIYWWKGDAIWGVMANAQLTRFDFTWLSHFPVLLILAAYLTVLWEIYFPALIWIRKTKYIALAFGFIFHALIAVTINLPFFGAIMIATYLLFLDKPFFEFFSKFLGKSTQGIIRASEERVV